MATPETEKRAPLGADHDAETRRDALKSLLESEGWKRYVEPHLRKIEDQAEGILHNNDHKPKTHAYHRGVANTVRGLRFHLEQLLVRAEDKSRQGQG